MKNLYLFIIFGIIAVWLGFFQFNNETLNLYYSKSVYYFHSISFILFIFCVVKAFLYDENTDQLLDKQVILDSIKRFLGFHWLAIVLSVTIMILSVFACKPDIRITADETNLLSTSQNLYERKECFVVGSSCETENGKKIIFYKKVDKRPAFFSYFLCLIHSLLGYKVENAFLFNSVIGILSLFLLYYLIQIYKGRFWGICGICCLSAYPIFIFYANSAGFDLFNMFCSLVLLLLIYIFIKCPKASYAEILFLWLLILGQSRYESVLSIFIVLPLVFYLMPKTEYSKLTFKTWIFPLLFLPSAWLFRITKDPSYWQLESLSQGFGLKWLFPNLTQAFVYFLTNEVTYGIIPLLSVLGIIGFIFLVLDVFKEKSDFLFGRLNQRETRLFIAFFILFYLLHAFAKFVYSWTDFTDVTISRQSIIFFPLIIFMAISFLSECNKKYGLKKSYCALAAVFLIFIYWPDLRMGCGLSNMNIYNSVRESRRYLELYYPNKADYILLLNNPNIFVPFKYSAIKYQDFESNKKLIETYLKNKTYKYLIRIQNLDLINKEKNMTFSLPGEFKEEIIYEVQIMRGMLLRLTKITLK